METWLLILIIVASFALVATLTYFLVFSGDEEMSQEQSEDNANIKVSDHSTCHLF